MVDHIDSHPSGNTCIVWVGAANGARELWAWVAKWVIALVDSTVTSGAPIVEQTLTQKLLAAPTELEIEFTTAIDQLFKIKDQLSYRLRSLLDIFLPEGKCDWSIYYSGFLDTLEIVLDSLWNDPLIDDICWVMSKIRAYEEETFVEEESMQPAIKALSIPWICSSCWNPEEKCDCIPF